MKRTALERGTTPLKRSKPLARRLSDGTVLVPHHSIAGLWLRVPPKERIEHKRRAPLARGTSTLKRTRIRPIGERGRADREALDLVRPVVLARAGHRCERCGLPPDIVGELHLHHRLRRSQGGTHEASNLAALDASCHDEIHSGSHDAHLWLVTRGGGS